MTKESKIEQVRADLDYVRSVVAQRGEAPFPVWSRVMWTVYCLVGFVWIDVQPPQGANFLLFGGLGCTALEFVFAAVFGHKRGERDREQELRELYQLLAFVLAGVAAAVLMVRGHFSPGYSPGQVYLILLGYHFVTAGVQFPPRVTLRGNVAVLLGVALLVGAVLISFFPTGVWSALGVVLALAIGSGFRFPQFGGGDHKGLAVGEGDGRG